MAIFVNENSKVIVQGMTGSEGTKHTKRMLKAGTNIVGGVTPGKGGQSVDMDGKMIPVFNSVSEAMGATGANAAGTKAVRLPPAERGGRPSPNSSKSWGSFENKAGPAHPVKTSSTSVIPQRTGPAEPMPPVGKSASPVPRARAPDHGYG